MNHIRLAMIEQRYADVAAADIIDAITGSDRLVMAADFGWDTKVTPENVNEALAWIKSHAGGSVDNKQESETKEVPEGNSEEITAIREEIDSMKGILEEVQSKENKELDMMNRLVDMVVELLRAKPARKRSKKASASETNEAADMYLALARSMVAADKKDGEDYRYDPKHENKPVEGAWEKTEEGWTKKKEKDDKGKKKEEGTPEKKTVLDSVKPAKSERPSWFDEKSPIDPNDQDSMKSRGFTPVEAETEVNDDATLTDAKTGKTYRFGDLPEGVKKQVVNRIKGGKMMKAPSAQKTEPAKTEETPPAHHEEVTKVLENVQKQVAPGENKPESEGVKTEPLKEGDKFDMSDFEKQFQEGMPKAKDSKEPKDHHDAVVKHVEKNTGVDRKDLDKSVNEHVDSLSDKDKENFHGKTVEDVHKQVVQDAAKKAPVSRHKTEWQKDEKGELVPPEVISVDVKGSKVKWRFDNLPKDAQQDILKDAKEHPEAYGIAEESMRKAADEQVLEPNDEQQIVDAGTSGRKLTDEQVEGIVDRVMEKLDNGNSEAAPAEGETPEQPAEETPTDDAPAEEQPSEETPAEQPEGDLSEEDQSLADEIDGIVSENPGEEQPAEPEGDLSEEDQSLADEIDGLASGKTEEQPAEDSELSEEDQDLADEIDDVASKEKKPEPDDSEEDIAVENLVLAAIRKSSRGMQQKRKDKDTMSDTGGGSYTRKDPKGKPPRDDVRKPFSEKHKKPENVDKDIDRDEDMKG